VNIELLTPLKLSGHQQTLYKGLVDKDQRLADIYLGSLTVLAHTGNPDRLALAAHGVRELIEKIPRFVDVQVKAQTESLKVKVRDLEDCWQTTLRNTACYKGGTWGDCIDSALSKMLKRLQAFFEWFNEHQPRRKAEIAATLQELEGSGRILPKLLEDLSIRDWDEIRDFFQGVCHHRKLTTPEEFSRRLDELERFLLDRLLPQTFADFDRIDEIIREGESDA
jgi:dGTP triphosphohydrolase